MSKTTNIREFAQSGLNTDVTPWDLPASFMTEMNNIRISGNFIESFGGYRTWDNALTGDPGWLMHVGAINSNFWIIPGRTSVQVWDGSTYSDISNSAGYAGVTDEDLWTGCMLGSIPVISHPQSYPEYWSPQSTGQAMQDLTFDGTNSWRDKGFHFKVIRSHKDFLIALNLEEGVNQLPSALRWSTPADVGGLPSTWDEADPTALAGKVALGGDGGDIIDGRTLRDNFIVYRERGITNMVYTGGQFVWQFKHLSDTVGLLAPECIYEIKGRHVLLGDGDILSNDGNSIQSLVHNRIRRRLNRELNVDNYLNSFVVGNNARKEVWFCVPEGEAVYPNMAYIWNWKDDTWGIRELPECSHIAYGPVTAPQLTWDSADIAAVTWDTAKTSWGGRARTPLEDTLVGVLKGSPGELLLLDAAANDAGQIINSTIERTGFPLEGHVNVTSIQRIYPNIRGTAPVLVEVGSQDHAGAPVRWKPGVTFTPGQDRKVDIRTTGELHAFRISSSSDGTWQLSGLDVEYVNAGVR